MTTFATLTRRFAYALLLFLLILIGVLLVVRLLIMRPVACMPQCTGMNLADRSLQGAQLVGANFVEANLQRVDFNGANLSEADFSGANLTDADLRNTDLRDARLIGADLTRANLGGATLAGVDLGGATLTGADLTAVDLTETLLSGASFVKAKLTDVKLTGANLAGVEFSNASLAGVNLANATLAGANLSRADLSGALLSGANMTGAWLNLANLTGVDARNADLTGSSLIGSQLTSANLEGSTLRGAILVGANLDGANLRGATLLEVRIEPETLTERELHLDPVLEELNELQLSAIRQPATLSGVQFNGATQWPTTFRPAVAVAAQVAQTTTTPLTNPLTTILPATTFAEVTGEGTTARRVKVNFFIDAIRAIDSVTGAYDIDCTLDFHWFDPTLVDQDVEQVEPARLWQPYLDLVNAEAFTIVSQHYQNSLEPGANVRLTYHVVGRFFTPFDLHKFPFDQQTFSIQLESADDDSEQVIFDFVYLLEPVAPSEEAYRQEVPRGRYIAANAAPADWQVAQVAIGQVVRVLPHDKSSWSQFRIDILMTRQALYYFWRTLLVLALIMFLVWGALLVDGEALAMRLWLLFLLCVMTVAVNALMTRSLPSSNVLTFLDLYRLICYGLILLMALAVVAVKLLYREPWRDWGVRLNRLLVIGYPLAVILVNVALYWYALG